MRNLDKCDANDWSLQLSNWDKSALWKQKLVKSSRWLWFLISVSFLLRTTGLYTKTLAKIIYYDISRFAVVFMVVFIGFCGSLYVSLGATNSQDLFRYEQQHIDPTPHRTALHTTPHHTALHCTALHCTAPPRFTSPHLITPNYTAPHFITLQVDCTTFSLHLTTPNYTVLHYTPHYTPLVYTKPNYTGPHYVALHCTALH